jgi:hypothetical protein
MTAGYIDSITPAIPLKRVGDPDEIAGLVAYLASGESGYMTGSSLTIDGGMTLCVRGRQRMARRGVEAGLGVLRIPIKPTTLTG